MDDERYQQLCLTHLSAFYRMAYSLLRNRQDAEDAVSQMLLKAWQSRSHARPDAERAWMMRILINECYTLLRQKGRRLAADQWPQADRSADTECTAALHAAIDTLPVKLRTPFLLKYMEGMSEKEVASALRLPPATVKNRLFRARKMLQSQLNEEVDS